MKKRICRTCQTRDARKGGTECNTCNSRRYARERPFKYHYNLLKQNAKRRGKHFELSFEEFRRVWLKHPVKWEEKKKWGHECPWQMDRKDNTMGYVDGNVQIMEKRKNILKYHQHDRFQMEVYWAEKNGQLRLEPEEEAPF